MKKMEFKTTKEMNTEMNSMEILQSHEHLPKMLIMAIDNLPSMSKSGDFLDIYSRVPSVCKTDTYNLFAELMNFAHETLESSRFTWCISEEDGVYTITMHHGTHLLNSTYNVSSYTIQEVEITNLSNTNTFTRWVAIYNPRNS